MAETARVVVLVLGLVYLVLAIVGMVTTGWGEFGWEDPVRVLGVLGTSTLLNIVHGVVGVVAVSAALRRGAVAFAPVLGVGFLALSAFGVVSLVVGDEGDPLNLTWGNVVLYLVSLGVCGVVYWMRARGVREGR